MSLKQSLKMKKNWENPEYRKKKISQLKGRECWWLKGKKIPKHSEWLKLHHPMKGKHHSEETKQKIRETKLKNPIHPKSEYKKGHKNSKEIEERRIQNVLKSSIIKPTKPEIQLNEILQKNFPNEWKYVGNGEIILGGFNPDFINCNGKKLIIEMFGNYWHNPNRIGIKSKDLEPNRKAIFKKFGYDTLVIWEKELRNKNDVLNKINNFVLRKAVK